MSKIESSISLRAPDRPRFILLTSFTDTIFVVLILDFLSQIAICGRFVGPKEVKGTSKRVRHLIALPHYCK